MAPILKKDVIKHIDSIPAFNATLAKVIQLSRDPDSQTKDLIKTISIDPNLTAEILKLINSAYFGLTGKVFSLNRAVVMLGMNTVKNVAISSSLITTLKMRDDFMWFTSDEFWEHSLGCAVGAKIIAEHLNIRVQEREEFFIAGLLHDIGKLVLVQHFPDEYSRLIDPDNSGGKTRSELEMGEFGLSHAELGSIMIKNWKLPETLSDTIGCHHKLSLSGDGYDRIKVAVHVADYECNKREIGIKNNGVQEKLDPEAYGKIGLDEGEVNKLFEDLEKQIENAKVFLKQ
jgi:putative nucleotidyltransferase with HDIG domain